MLDPSETVQARGTSAPLPRESRNRKWSDSIRDGRRTLRALQVSAQTESANVRDHGDAIVGVRNGVVIGTVLWALLFTVIAVAL